jgi:hypothetical protein
VHVPRSLRLSFTPYTHELTAPVTFSGAVPFRYFACRTPVSRGRDERRRES